jgi:hydrogenase large subunit
MNRVEGDLEIEAEIAGGLVADAWCSGTMFRGFEQILAGRGALDGLVITPRICGICGTAHLTAASRALDGAAGVEVPDNGLRLRNTALMIEHLQSDMRHAFLMFMADFAGPAYLQHPLHEEAVRRYTPFSGETTIETVHETKKVLEIVAIVGGQWPHSSYMVPGGVVSVPSESDLIQCFHLLARYRRWYEKRVLGCELERWDAIRSAADLDVWLEEKNEHRQSEVGFYLRFARQAGLDAIGKGHGNFLSYGALDLPRQTKVKPVIEGDMRLVPAGFARGAAIEAFDHEKITEHVAHSWFEDPGGARHPLDGSTSPYASGREGDKYSWAKAPRYDGAPAETGPLAEMIVARRPLFLDLLRKAGPTVLVRELARLTRPALLAPVVETWLREMSDDGDGFYNRPGEIVEGVGIGLTHAARGALGHWVKIQDRKIVHYQIITPTAWHASPRDDNGIRGVIEEALVGTPVKDASNPIEIGHVIRSFDPCLVCTVHSVSKHGSRTLIRL